MPRLSPAIEEDDLAAPKRPWTRPAFQAALERRYSPRLHMSLILASSGFAAMIASWSLLHLGVGSMLVRYPIAISLAYATFLVGVWTWLRAMGFIDNDGRSRRSGSSLDGGDLPISGSSGGGGGGSVNVSLPRGGGGSFDGGGANASWAEGQSTPVAFMGRSSAGKAGGSAKGGTLSLGDGIDGDGIVLLLLALALVAVIFITSGYLIYVAPDVLTEAAFGAALAGTLTRASRKQAPNGWIAGVVRKTWAPYAVVLVAAIAFAGYASAKYPQAKTFRQAIHLAVSNSEN
jgi:hypothetical protein